VLCQHAGCHPRPCTRLEAMLPPWARLRRVDPSRPLAEQVASAHVLIPTSSLVGPQELAAASACRLVAQPCAGCAEIDQAAAAQRGIPVTCAPGARQAHRAAGTPVCCLATPRRAHQHTNTPTCCSHAHLHVRNPAPQATTTPPQPRSR
jgi:phosphoglycerate dehydrogenase-like enzyme